MCANKMFKEIGYHLSICKEGYMVYESIDGTEIVIFTHLQRFTKKMNNYIDLISLKELRAIEMLFKELGY